MAEPLLLFVLAVPLGLALLRGAEWTVGRPFRLTVPERLLSAFFLTGAFFYVVASLTLPLFTAALVVAVLASGAIAMAVLWGRSRGRSLTAAIAWLRSWPAILLLGGTVGLFLIEVVPTGTRLLPNGIDGSWASLMVRVILDHHSIPATLRPYADYGLIYPAGAAVWMSLPSLLFGWPVVSDPVGLPPLFLALSLIGAYCWGERLGGVGSDRGQRTGLVFAAFFGLVGSWPRFFVGGSFDFAFSLPLLLMLLGWLPSLLRGPVPGWKETAAFGALLGVCAGLSAAVGELLILLLVGFLVAFAPRIARTGTRWGIRVVAIVAIEFAFVVRSLAGFVVWYSYPSHVLESVGSGLRAASPVGPPPPTVSLVGDLDPFVLWKPKMSPFPSLDLELTILLVGGLVVLAAWAWTPGGRLRRLLTDSVVRPVLMTASMTFLATAGFVLLVPSSIGTPWLAGVSNVDEISYFLFLSYQALALLPILLAIEFLASSRGSPEPPAEAPSVAPSHRIYRNARRKATSVLSAQILAGLLVVSSLGVGAGVTALDAPGYLAAHLNDFANATTGDLDALAWAGAHLPDCSRVLVAPGSAAEFLPEYSASHLVFPVLPLSVNGSYARAIDDLTRGVYSTDTRAALLALNISEVFVTGQTSVSYPPLRMGALTGSPDFSELYRSGDAGVFLFLPGSAPVDCPPS
ncbi:MAG: hypothetical protein WAK40_05100 [Thermoplasmata archaeon]